MKINVLALAVTLGFLWGVTIFLMTWWIIMFDGALTEPNLLGRLYRGYRITPAGSVIGLVWGLIDGFIGGAVIAWVYNKLVDRLPTASPAKQD